MSNSGFTVYEYLRFVVVYYRVLSSYGVLPYSFMPCIIPLSAVHMWISPKYIHCK